MLIELLRRCAKAGGDNLNDSPSKISLLADVNEAAKRVWDDHDLVGSIREETICTDTTEGMATLNWYAGFLRGCKLHYTRQNVVIHDEHRFFQTYQYFQAPYTLRYKADVAIRYSLDIATQVTLTLKSAESKAFTVTVVGSTQDASSWSETVTFNPGETIKVTTALYCYNDNEPLSMGISDIVKSAETENDITVTDAQGRELSTLPNRLKYVKYPRVQLYDQTRFVIDQCFDVLFKLHYVPMMRDNDNLLNGIYDEAIYWKFVSNRARLRQNDQLALAFAQDADIKCEDIIESIAAQKNEAVVQQLDFGTNRFNGMLNNALPNNRGFGPYNDLYGYR